MRRILIIVSILFTLGSSAQTKMSQVLKLMPFSVVPYLSENNKLDLIDFVESDMKAEVHNLLDGKSELLKLTDHYASLLLNEVTQMDMRLLDVEEPIDSARQIICVVTTYGIDIRDSQIDFYSVKWRKLDATERIMLPDAMFTAKLDEQLPVLTITFTHGLDILASEEQKEINKLSMTLKWDRKSFNKD